MTATFSSDFQTFWIICSKAPIFYVFRGISAKTLHPFIRFALAAISFTSYSKIDDFLIPFIYCELKKAPLLDGALPLAHYREYPPASRMMYQLMYSWKLEQLTE